MTPSRTGRPARAARGAAVLALCLAAGCGTPAPADQPPAEPPSSLFTVPEAQRPALEVTAVGRAAWPAVVHTSGT
ncbi:MAG: hypothetical protein AB7V01_17235, partial [Vicinamibacterales bacterium]